MHTLNKLFIPVLLTIVGCDHADTPPAIDDEGGSTSGPPVALVDEASTTDDDPTTPEHSTAGAPDPCEWNGACGGLVEESTCPGGWAASCGDAFGCIDPGDARIDACLEGGSSSGDANDPVEPDAGETCPGELGGCFKTPADPPVTITCETFCLEEYGTVCEPAGIAGVVYPEMTDCLADAAEDSLRAGQRIPSCFAPLPLGQAARCRCAAECE